MNILPRSSRTLFLLAASFAAAAAEDSGAARDWASLIGNRFKIERDVVYKHTGALPLKVDVYFRYDRRPGPTVLYIHGGGWANGSKEQYVLWFLPYLELGMRVVSVQYRLSGVAPAPAAVEDCRCAFGWVGMNAAKYGIDPKRIVVTGGSAGGHLALLTGMLDSSVGFDCPEVPPPHAAAIINYYGVTDLAESIESQNASALKWLRGAPDMLKLARRLSPITYVRPDMPPVLSIHGDADQMVPYSHAVKLHKALTETRVPNRLVTIPGGKHGRFEWSDADTIRVQRAIESFLGDHHVLDDAGWRKSTSTERKD